MTASTQRSLLLEAVQDAARVAGGVAMRHYRSDFAVESKADGSPVTIADREAETAVREWIGRRFPNDGIEGEEFGVARTDARRRWIIDPIDGTKTFVRGVPLWGTLIAVLDGTEVLAGAIFCPVVDELVAAAPGEGAWWNGTRCSVSTIDRIDRATVLTSSDYRPGEETRRDAWRELSDRALVSRTWGDCYGYLLVATGRAEVMADPRMAVWDAAPLLPIIEEAGGVFTDWSGARTVFGSSAIATNAALALPTRDLLVR
ncbi:MAG TPA: inositol monophosphatase family protein [Gemmatimonadaceae bacterium]|nr:inositol monophosphatase family protein [Gemmatimonadaceae bacterium]